MGLTHVTVVLRSLASDSGSYDADFLVHAGATDSLAPAAELIRIGVRPVGRMVYELADGSFKEYPFGLVEIAFMGELTAGRVIFGPNTAEPLLGVTALESVGITMDPANRTLKRLPAIPLKADRNHFPLTTHRIIGAKKSGSQATVLNSGSHTIPWP